MGNMQDGKLSMDIGGETYTMSLTIDAMVRLEEMFAPLLFAEISEKAERGSMTHIRAFIWAVFVDNHPEITINNVGKLIANGGGLERFTNKLAELAGISKPDPRDLQTLGAKPNPPAAQAATPRGTGARSTTKRAAQA